MSPGAGVAPRAAAVLFVCTGNVCRSPAAELLLRAGLGADAGVEVASAGLAALVGEPVAAPMAARLRARGVDPAGFAARQLRPAMVLAADVVLTMTADQRCRVVARVPAAVRRTFTLREFAALAELAGPGPGPAGPGDRLAALVQAAPRARAQRRAVPGGDDIEDPYRRPDAVFASVLAQIEAATGRLLDRLAPAIRHTASPECADRTAATWPFGVNTASA